MSISKTIAPHLPYLRRFARSLSGSQSAGDAYAVSTLEAIVAEPATFDATIDPRVALYKIFLQVWHSMPLNGIAPHSAGAEAVGKEAGYASGLQRLEELTPRSRVAFLLSAVEGFGIGQIAMALECTDTEASQFLGEAGRELARQISTDVLIIEDEPIIAMDIESLVEGLGHKVNDIARTQREAVAAVQRKRPGLILADVHLADGSSGIDAVNEILASFDVPVIFITAYPERLLTGERPEPTFLITKPFQPEMVKAMISQALFFNQKSSRSSSLARVTG